MNRAMIFKEEVLDSDGHTLYVEHFSNSMVILPPPVGERFRLPKSRLKRCGRIFKAYVREIS